MIISKISLFGLISIVSLLCVLASSSGDSFVRSNRLVLIGDVGGTNIRLALANVNAEMGDYYQIFQRKYKVSDFEIFEESIVQFLIDSEVPEHKKPDLAVLAFAGPVSENSVILTNVPKWGVISVKRLKQKFQISEVLITNDFIAASYGLLDVGNQNFLPVNGFSEANKSRIRGVLGPGTGLGYAIILPKSLEFGTHDDIVLGSEGGHTDISYIDEQTFEFTKYFKEVAPHDHLDTEKSLSGRTIPFIFQFYKKKLGLDNIKYRNDPENIIQNCLQEHPEQVYQLTLQMYMKFYSAIIANFIIIHMCAGGVYLVGSITKSIAPKMIGVDILADWKIRHPEMASQIDKVPIFVSKQVDLGLRGVYYLAKRYLRNRLE